MRNSSGDRIVSSPATREHVTQSCNDASIGPWAGWCPRQVEQIERTYGEKLILCLSHLNRQGFREVDHSLCIDEQFCIAYRTDMRHYATKHRAPDCDCPMIDVDYGQLIEIISSGAVPLVSIHNEEGNLRLHFEPRKSGSWYTAVSHVWFDGLGNPDANALPRCQLLYLQGCLTRMPPEHESTFCYRLSFPGKVPLFWLDTLCIPIKREHSSLREQQINKMASIYAGAVQVLVLDAELQRIHSARVETCEALARIIFSAWMQRSWTLQEGVLGHEIIYQFADRATNALDLPKPPGSRSDIHEKLWHCLWNKLQSGRKGNWYIKKKPVFPRKKFRATKMADIRIVTTSEFQELEWRDAVLRASPDDRRLAFLVRTWNELAHRSTTKPEDIHVIMANLLDFHADAVTKEKEDKRLCRMILSCRRLPISLFYNTGPRLQQTRTHKNRWIPVKPSTCLLTETPVMNIGINRLVFGLTEYDVRKNPTQPFIIRDTFIDSTLLTFMDHSTNIFYNIKLLTELDDDMESVRAACSSFCLLFEQGLPATENAAVRGALFHVISERACYAGTSIRSEHLEVLFDCPLEVSRAADAECYQQLECYPILSEICRRVEVTVQCEKPADFEPFSSRAALFKRTSIVPLTHRHNSVYWVQLIIIISFNVLAFKFPFHDPSGDYFMRGLALFFDIITFFAMVDAFRHIPATLLAPLAFRMWLASFDDVDDQAQMQRVQDPRFSRSDSQPVGERRRSHSVSTQSIPDERTPLLG